MANVRFGGGVVDMRGSIGGNTFSRTRSGSVVRARSNPINPQSPAQVAQRLRMSAANTAWSGMTAAQRVAWETYAANVPVTNAMGEVVYNTGQNWFIGSATARLEAGQGVERCRAVVARRGDRFARAGRLSEPGANEKSSR